MNALEENPTVITPPPSEPKTASSGEGAQNPPNITATGNGEEPQFVTTEQERKGVVQAVEDFIKNLVPH